MQIYSKQIDSVTLSLVNLFNVIYRTSARLLFPKLKIRVIIIIIQPLLYRHRLVALLLFAEIDIGVIDEEQIAFSFNVSAIFICVAASLNIPSFLTCKSLFFFGARSSYLLGYYWCLDNSLLIRKWSGA